MTAIQTLEKKVRRLEDVVRRLTASDAIRPVLSDPNAVPIRAGDVTEVYLADGSVTTLKIGNQAVTGIKIADATIGNAKISDLAVDKLTAGSLTVALDLDVGGSINVTGGEITVTDGAGNEALLNASGLQVTSERGSPFLSLMNQAADRSLDFTMDPSGGRSLWLSSNVNGALSEVVWIDQVVSAGLGASLSDIFSFGPTAVGAIFMIHCHRTDTNASLGHIFAANGAGVLNYVSATDTEASSAGTVSPAIGLNASDGLDFEAHASFNTRFVGLCMVIYD